MHTVHLRRLVNKSRCRARLALGRPPIVVYGPSQSWDSPHQHAHQRGGVCLRVVWFLVGGVAVVCWTEKLGTKQHGWLPWEAKEWHKSHEKKMEHLQHVISCHGAQWAAMHKDRASSSKEKKL
ncbi:unnamed protein product [Rhizoctonia solani]|uniref:Uncharacterized protein n=1 Tax=Rhizoctonia solani TaxID=456999 RepID=A0A8H3CSH2_9AGAM|nr:unnamed protein product [Rhizoctonia solani]CAE6497168.1 unnamed protein product [Rhizoctonia solani]